MSDRIKSLGQVQKSSCTVFFVFTVSLTTSKGAEIQLTQGSLWDYTGTASQKAKAASRGRVQPQTCSASVLLTGKCVFSDMHPLGYLSFLFRTVSFIAYPLLNLQHSVSPGFFPFFLSFLPALASFISLLLLLNSSPRHAHNLHVFGGQIRNAAIDSSPNTVCTSFCKC